MNLLKKAGMGIAFLLLSLSLPAYGPKTVKRLTGATVSLASPALRAVLKAYPGKLDRGIESALKEFGGATPEAVKTASAKEVGTVAHLLREKAPLDSIVFHFGRVAGLAWVANDPLLFGGDVRSREIRPDFEDYVERKLNRMMLAFDGYDRPPLGGSVESYIAWRIAGGARYRKALFFCYFKGGKRISSKTFDDRSNAFGVAQVILSHGISDAVKLWFAMWRSMDGDVSGTPYYHPVNSPKAERKNPNPAIQTAKGRQKPMNTSINQKHSLPDKGLGAFGPKGSKAPRVGWGPNGLCPWGGEGMALPVKKEACFLRKKHSQFEGALFQSRNLGKNATAVPKGEIS